MTKADDSSVDPDVVALRERLTAVRQRTAEFMDEQRKLADLIALIEEQRR